MRRIRYGWPVTRHKVHVADMDASRVNAYEHVALPDLGLVDLL
jgi:hypothetical protein